MTENPLRYAVIGLTNLLKLVVGRGRVQSGKDDGPVQILQLQLGPKELSNLRRLAEFGFTSWPPNGADAVAIFVGGDRSNGVIIATGDQKTRFKLENAGESAMSDAFGKSVWFKKDGGIVIEAAGQDVTVNGAANVVVHASTKVTIDAPNAEFTGAVKIDGALEVDGNIVGHGTIGDGVRTIEDDRAIYDSHTHPDGSPNTGPPNQHE